MRIALFVTCLADAMFPESAKATVRLLERLGHQVVFPAWQTCCGQMHVNTGYSPRRFHLSATMWTRSKKLSFDVAVAPSGSCVGSVRHQHAMVARRYGDDALAARAASLAGRTYELSELLVDVLGVTDVGAYYPHRVTYHPTCHSLRMLRVDDKPLRLLRAVRGIDACRASGRRIVLRLRRDIRAEECGHLDGHACRQDDQHLEHRCRSVQRERLVVPHAHRRRPVPTAQWSTDRAPCRDLGEHRRGRRGMSTFLGNPAYAGTGICAGTRASPRRHERH